MTNLLMLNHISKVHKTAFFCLLPEIFYVSPGLFDLCSVFIMIVMRDSGDSVVAVPEPHAMVMAGAPVRFVCNLLGR